MVYQLNKSEIFTFYYFQTVIVLSSSVEFTAAVAQWAREYFSQAEGWVFVSQPRQTLVVKTGSDTSTAKPLAISVSVRGPRR